MPLSLGEMMGALPDYGPQLMQARQLQQNAVGGMRDAVQIKEQGRANLAQEGLAGDRLAEMQRSAEERESFARDREEQRVVEQTRETRLKVLKDVRGLAEAGRMEAAKQMLDAAGFDTKVINSKETLTAEGKKLAKQVDTDRIAAEQRAIALEDDAISGAEAMQELQAEAGAAVEAAPSAEGMDPTAAVGAEEEGNLDAFINQMGAQGAVDIAQQPSGMVPLGPQPGPVEMAPNGEPLIALPPPAPALPPQAPPQPMPQPQQPMPGQPGMDMAMGVPPQPQVNLEQMKQDMMVERAIQVQRATVSGRATLEAQKAGLPESDQVVYDAMIEAVGPIMAANGGDFEAGMKAIAAGEGTKPIIERIVAREKIAASERNARRMASRSQDKDTTGNYDKGRKMVDTRMRSFKVYSVIEQQEDLSKALAKIGSSNIADQAEGLKALAKAREPGGRLSNQDMNDLPGKKSFWQTVNDFAYSGSFGGFSQKEQTDFLKSIAFSIRRNKANLGKMKERAETEVKNAQGRGSDFGQGASDAAGAIFGEEPKASSQPMKKYGL